VHHLHEQPIRCRTLTLNSHSLQLFTLVALVHFHSLTRLLAYLLPPLLYHSDIHSLPPLHRFHYRAPCGSCCRPAAFPRYSPPSLNYLYPTVGLVFSNLRTRVVYKYLHPPRRRPAIKLGSGFLVPFCVLPLSFDCLVTNRARVPLPASRVTRLVSFYPIFCVLPICNSRGRSRRVPLFTSSSRSGEVPCSLRVRLSSGLRARHRSLIFRTH